MDPSNGRCSSDFGHFIHSRTRNPTPIIGEYIPIMEFERIGMGIFNRSTAEFDHYAMAFSITTLPR